jgi:hypothetical protein
MHIMLDSNWYIVAFSNLSLCFRTSASKSMTEEQQLSFMPLPAKAVISAFPLFQVI